MDETSNFDEREDEQPEHMPWDSLDSESIIRYNRFVDYLHQHPEQSLLKLANQYKIKDLNET